MIEDILGDVKTSKQVGNPKKLNGAIKNSNDNNDIDNKNKKLLHTAPNRESFKSRKTEKLDSGREVHKKEFEKKHKHSKESFDQDKKEDKKHLLSGSKNQDSFIPHKIPIHPKRGIFRFKRSSKSFNKTLSVLQQDFELINLINESQHLRYKGRVVLLNSVIVNVVDLKGILPWSTLQKQDPVRLEYFENIYQFTNFLRNLKNRSSWNRCILCQKGMLGIRKTTRWLDDPVAPPNLMVPLRWAHLSIGNPTSDSKVNIASEDGKVSQFFLSFFCIQCCKLNKSFIPIYFLLKFKIMMQHCFKNMLRFLNQTLKCSAAFPTVFSLMKVNFCFCADHVLTLIKESFFQFWGIMFFINYLSLTLIYKKKLYVYYTPTCAKTRKLTQK